MKFIIYACVACVMSVRADVIIDGVRHRPHILYKNISELHFLHFDAISDNLYFRDNDKHLIGRINLISSELKYIEGISNANYLTVDQGTQTVYVAASDGLYKYTPSTDETELIGLTDVNVWNVDFSGGILYYNHDTSDITSTVNAFIDGESTMFAELDYKVDYLLIYNEDIIYFSNGGVLYRQKNGKKAVLLFIGDSEIEFSVDIHGKVYFCTNNAIYQIFNDRDTVRKVATIENLWGMTFDINNNIIYSDSNDIYVLKPVDEMKEKEKLEYVVKRINEKIDDLETKINATMETFENKDTRMNNLEQTITSIVEQQLHRTISAGCSPRTVHLDMRNVPISMDHEPEQLHAATSTLAP